MSANKLTCALIAITILLLSCEPQQNKQTTDELITSNVQHYFFLNDAIPVSTEIIDTLYAVEVEELLNSLNRNLNLIDGDLDTLSQMIDKVAYGSLDHEELLQTAVGAEKLRIEKALQADKFNQVNYTLKQQMLLAKKQEFKQTNRILLHLKRSITDSIAGYNVIVDYELGNSSQKIDLLLDASFDVVD